MEYIKLIDFLLLPVLIFFIYFFAQAKKKRKIETNPEFLFYLPGLTAKVFGGLAFALIYALYYRGGDPLNYYHDSICWNKLLFENPKAFVKIFKEGVTAFNTYLFTPETGYPNYWRDEATNYVVRITFIASFIGFRSYLIATVLFSLISFGGVWRLYKIFITEFPQLRNQLAFAIFFIPSVIFWGSGILKDTITFSCIGYFIFSFYQAAIIRKKILINLLVIFIASFLILKIKPYIMIALAPGSLIWLIDSRLSKIKGSFVKAIATPLFLSISVLSGYALLELLSSQLGQYSLESVIEKAVVSQQDLKREEYQGNSFDIGELEATVSSLLSHSHKAINASLFRPYLWEANNIVMIFSGVENLFFLFITLYVIIKGRLIFVFKYFKNHLLKFSLLFSLFFGFSVGVSTSNFGSMVRYRIPILPFYIGSLLIINHQMNEAKSRKKELLGFEGYSLT